MLRYHPISSLTPLSSSHHRHNHHHAPPLLPPPPRLLTVVVRAAGSPPPLTPLPPSPPPTPAPDDAGGPIELLPSSPSPLFAVDDNPSPLQVATSVLLTGSISIFLFRSLRRRAKRAQELRVRSTGVTAKKDIKEEALERLKTIGVAPLEAGTPPSPAQALLGAIAAGAIAVILYRFTTTIEASLNRQSISDNFSVRQITITVRTIVNGICYLATFVFGINSVGLLLYSIQLAFSSLMGTDTSNLTSTKKEDVQVNATDPTVSSKDTSESKSYDIRDSSDNS